ncbi:MAG: GntR family transcriptional regulator [Pyramidobacter sp.]|uniref:GntR family transcriptional regulator n=1 Tax=Pyramidobacter sp. TaxID=1943581 RepID=UPI002A81664D|nr:GntR family transcriptional regulator [Pyramidobacter sp.]MDY4031434.1 GntR family transcriptional regulator [Pyramidobacter sp.]MDY4172361.1 GntR family transcriptional regulator [Evtepia sp.]
MKKTKNADAYEKIKGLILREKLELGRCFSILTLAERIGLGRAPVTDAIKRLEAENFLTVIPHQGIMVKEMSVQEMRQINETRQVLEPYITEKVAYRFNDKDAEKFRGYIEQMKVHADSLDYYEFIVLDHRMHMELYDLFENKCMVGILENLRDRIFTVGYKIVARREGRMQTTILEHQAILEALIKRDPEEAAEKMRIHLTNGWNLI